MTTDNVFLLTIGPGLFGGLALDLAAGTYWGFFAGLALGALVFSAVAYRRGEHHA